MKVVAPRVSLGGFQSKQVESMNSIKYWKLKEREIDLWGIKKHYKIENAERSKR